MTAAEWRKGQYTVHHPEPIHAWAMVLAALEERERLLGEREAMVAGGWYQDKAQCFWCKEVLAKDQAPAHVIQCDKRPDHSDAALGALVRRIREHPMVQRAGSTALLLTAHGNDGRDYWQPHFDGLTACLSHLDSLLPKEPEVVRASAERAAIPPP